MTVFFLFEKKKSKAINELSRQLHSIYIIKHDIIGLFFDDHEFELEITRNPPQKVVGFLRENRLKNLKFSFSPEKTTYLYSKKCGKINTGETMTENLFLSGVQLFQNQL